LKGVWILLPVIGAVDARRTVRCIKPDTEGRRIRITTDTEDTCGLVWKHDCTGAENIRLDMHLAPSMRKIVGKAQVQFVRASGVVELGRGAIRKKGDLAIDADGGKPCRCKSWNEVLR
jgi:hypothetical protein